MSDRFPVLIGGLLGVIAAIMLSQISASGQVNGERGKQRTAWGDPDLRGVYTFATETPLQRSEILGNKTTYTDSELAEMETEAAARAASRSGPSEGPPPGGYDRIWLAGEQGTRSNRTSLIIDPSNGRIPPLTPEAQLLLAERTAEIESRRVSIVGNDGEAVLDTAYNTWTDLSPYHRCQARSIPRTWQAYNHGIQIVQIPGYVVLHYESMHDARIIPLDGRAALDANIRQWNGSSRGHWEDDTLVVHLTNFTEKQTTFPLRNGVTESLFPMGDMQFVERFTRIDENTVQYAVTVDAPTTWASPWTFILPLRSDDQYQFPEHIYEFACHEGNYRMMEDTLMGSRTLLELAQP